MKKLILIFLTSTLLTGCWNYRELNDISLVSAIAIEQSIDNDFIITVQIMSTKKEEGSGGTSSSSSSVPITVLKAKDKTFAEALKKISHISPKELYIGHVNLIIIDENIAKAGINNFIDFLIRNTETRKQFNVLLAKNEAASDVLTILTPLEENPGIDIIDSLNNISRHYGSTAAVNFDELLARKISPGIEMVIPTINILGNTEDGSNTDNFDSSAPKSNIKINGFAAFKKDKLVGFLNEKESIAFNIIRNNIKHSTISFKCDEDNWAAVEILTSKTKTKIQAKDKKASLNLTVSGDAVQSEVNCKVDMESLEGRKIIQDGINNEVKKMINQTIDKIKTEIKSDILGFGQHLYRYKNKQWKEISDEWDNIFEDLNYKVEVNYKLTKKGSSLTSIKER